MDDTLVTRRLADDEGEDEVRRGPADGVGRWEPGSLVAGRYLITEVVGQGGMGIVVAADDLLLRKSVAVKALRPDRGADWEAVERFRQEVALAHAITHPNVSRIFDLGEDEGVVYFSMERLTGESLQARLKRERKLSVPATLRIANRVCEALAVAHEAKVVHRDLKPSNIMLVDDEREVVLMDFGISASLDEGHRPVRRRSVRSGDFHVSSMGLGTPRFMPPEQWRGEPSTPASDLYALGCILFECLTGRPPFVREGQDAYMEAHTTVRPKRVTELEPKISAHVADAIDRCLEKDPRRRFQDADALIVTLEPSGRRGAGRALLLRALVTGLVVALLGFGLLELTRYALVTEMRPAVRRLAELTAMGIDEADLDRIHTPEDMDSEAFRRVHAHLGAVHAANPDVRFLYVWRRLEGQDEYEFVVDEEAYDHDDNGDGVIQPNEVGVQPGRRYVADGLPRLAECVRTGYATADDEFSSDEYALTLSGYARIGTNDGPGAYVVGVDVDNQRMATVRMVLVTLCLAAWPLLVALPRWMVFFAVRRRAHNGAA